MLRIGAITTIFLLAMLILFTTSGVAASIKNSKHDLRGVIPGMTDVCSACHGGAHHWIPGAPGMSREGQLITDVYNSATLDHSIDTTYINTPPSDAPLCLSCHDGTLASSKYPYLASTNIPGSDADIGAGPNGLGGDLSDDHPVGFIFNASLDKGIKDPTVAKVSFGQGGNAMWCASCHEVHDPTHVPFLIMDNTQSALCRDCHIK